MVHNEIPEPETVRCWEEIVAAASGLDLPEDLRFMRDLIGSGLKKLKGGLGMEEFREVAASYKSLWLKERKPENLDAVLKKFSLVHFV
jgi:hypothetical protein